MKDERLGEQVCACIRLKNGHSSSAEEIKAFCKGQVSLGRQRQGRVAAAIFCRLMFVCSPVDLPLQDPPLCGVCGQLPSDRVRKGTILWFIRGSS